MDRTPLTPTREAQIRATLAQHQSDIQVPAPYQACHRVYVQDVGELLSEVDRLRGEISRLHQGIHDREIRIGSDEDEKRKMLDHSREWQVRAMAAERTLDLAARETGEIDGI